MVPTVQSNQANQAILGRKRPAQSVLARDFASPCRLAPERMRELSGQLENLLPTLEKRLQGGLGLQVGLTLETLQERDAEHIFQDAADPLCVLRFGIGSQPAWLAWDPAAAVAVIETLFGGRGGASTARMLSPTEATVAVGLMTEIAGAMTAALGLEVNGASLVQTQSELGSWHEGGEGAQPHRLEIRLGLDNEGQSSLLSLYLPGVGPSDAEGSSKPLPESLPQHLDQVEIEVTARLRGCEISLDQLLAIEEGDVIPLDARVGDPTVLCVDGMTLAEGRLGSHHGRLAVRIERLKVAPESLV